MGASCEPLVITSAARECGPTRSRCAIKERHLATPRFARPTWLLPLRTASIERCVCLPTTSFRRHFLTLVLAVTWGHAVGPAGTQQQSILTRGLSLTAGWTLVLSS